ncbi:uncharacterized protein LOC123887684 [Trifolium pratense]|uniref:uncharacterized protein LOC123887684 n=1 Tax=Trifolium pratense TaxID=57577 RepID=UPI001E6973BE|nr:uncharacterized protein LOC123887684 [Trifolium pratense]
MVAKEFYTDKEAGHEESTLLQDQYDDDDDETLSLSDLPNSTISPQWNDFSKESNHNGDDDDDDNLFEFFSEEFNTSTTHDNIIFCGKLIPFKDHQHVPHNQKTSVLVPKTRLSSKSLKSRDDVKGKEDQEVKGSLNVKSFPCDYTTMGGKVSLVRSPTKSRWFLFLFGLSLNSRSSSKEMQLSDIRNRQSRREPMMMFPAAPGNGKEVAKSKKNGNYKGMWKMLKSVSFVLGCSRSSKLANDVVKAAFV